MDRIRDWDSGEIGESRSYPLIAVHLSGAGEWTVGPEWGRKERFGWRYRRFGEPVSSFGGAALGVGCWECGHWGEWRDGGGTDLMRQLTMAEIALLVGAEWMRLRLGQ